MHFGVQFAPTNGLRIYRSKLPGGSETPASKKLQDPGGKRTGGDRASMLRFHFPSIDRCLAFYKPKPPSFLPSSRSKKVFFSIFSPELEIRIWRRWR